MIAHGESPALRIISNNDAIQLRIDPDDVLRAARRDQALALADCVSVNSGVCSDHLTALVDNRAGQSGLGSGIFFDKIGIRPAFDETDFLRLGLFRCRQSITPGNLDRKSVV